MLAKVKLVILLSLSSPPVLPRRRLPTAFVVRCGRVHQFAIEPNLNQMRTP